MGKKKGNGFGTIYKFRNGYRAQITVGYQKDGRLKRKSISGKTAAEVKRKMIALQNELQCGNYLAASMITVPELAKIMLQEERGLNLIKEGTYHRNMETVKIIERDSVLGKTPIQKLEYLQIKNFLFDQTKRSQSAINKIFTTLKKTLKEAVKRKIIAQNPMDDMKRPKTTQPTRKVRAFTVEEQQRFLKVLYENDIPYAWQMLLSLYTGMRMGEVNALEIRDINLNFGTITVDKTISRDGKGKAFISETTKTIAGTRNIHLSKAVLPLAKEIVKYCGTTKYVFSDGEHFLNTNQVNMQFRRVLEKYNILDPDVKGKVSLHSLRHSFATRCIEAGMQPKVLQK
ncbi:MAG: site-specific integrase, partial [Clostridia bacterium]|nr:site-specific integrase [Clostridia bacterium]